mmetsp:Transcript_1932/g.6915  ORF Transcript_1932/g.6915 Transcript_1932/m.6915 type:complete len:223 (-) Transcript_1932:551-1219(-)
MCALVMVPARERVTLVCALVLLVSRDQTVINAKRINTLRLQTVTRANLHTLVMIANPALMDTFLIPQDLARLADAVLRGPPFCLAQHLVYAHAKLDISLRSAPSRVAATLREPRTDPTIVFRALDNVPARMAGMGLFVTLRENAMVFSLTMLRSVEDTARVWLKILVSVTRDSMDLSAHHLHHHVLESVQTTQPRAVATDNVFLLISVNATPSLLERIVGLI